MAEEIAGKKEVMSEIPHPYYKHNQPTGRYNMPKWLPKRPIELGANLRKLVGVYVEELDRHYAKMKVMREKREELKKRVGELKARITTIEEMVDDPRTLEISKWLTEDVF